MDFPVPNVSVLGCSLSYTWSTDRGPSANPRIAVDPSLSPLNLISDPSPPSDYLMTPGKWINEGLTQRSPIKFSLNASPLSTNLTTSSSPGLLPHL